MFSFPVNLASGGADSSEEEEELPLHRYIRELQEEEDMSPTCSFSPSFMITPATPTGSTSLKSLKSPTGSRRGSGYQSPTGARLLSGLKSPPGSRRGSAGMQALLSPQKLASARSTARSRTSSATASPSASPGATPGASPGGSPCSLSPSLSREASPLQADAAQNGSAEETTQSDLGIGWGNVSSLLRSAAQKLTRSGSGVSTEPTCADEQDDAKEDAECNQYDKEVEELQPVLSRTKSMPQPSTGSSSPSRSPKFRRTVSEDFPEERRFSFGLDTVKALRKRLSRAASLSVAEEEDQVQDDGRKTFPMYTVSMQTLLEMMEALPHEELKAKGLLSVYSRDMGKAAYVSHEWVGRSHPDPEFRQLAVLQEALKMIVTGLVVIPSDAVGEQLFPGFSMASEQFRSESLHLWYDYFSCPQIECTSEDRSAVASSIPQYIDQAEFFFALCPPVRGSDSKMLNTHSWANRGWCRFERTLREFSAPWILVQSNTTIEVMSQTQVATVYGGPPGEGYFDTEADKKIVADLLSDGLRSKLMSCLRAGDIVGYRIYLNLQNVLFRGLPLQPIDNLVPGFEVRATDLDPVVARFLFQNGFKSVTEVDEAGWAPLCYACLRGDVTLVKGLLDQDADPSVQTHKAQPLVNLTAWNSAVSICAYFKQNDVLQLLLKARAKLDSGWNPPISAAAVPNNAEGIRILCDAGTSPSARNSFGLTPLECACGAGATACIDELLRNMHGKADTSRALHFAMWYRGGTEEVLARLLRARADLNEQIKQSSTSLLGINWNHLSLQYRLGMVTTSTRIAYHSYESTPLMLAVLSGQHAGALALVERGARLDLRNSWGRTAADLAVEVGAATDLIRALGSSAVKSPTSSFSEVTTARTKQTRTRGALKARLVSLVEVWARRA